MRRPQYLVCREIHPNHPNSSFLGLASEKFFKSNSRKKQKEVQNEKRGHFNRGKEGDILIEL